MNGSISLNAVNGRVTTLGIGNEKMKAKIDKTAKG